MHIQNMVINVQVVIKHNKQMKYAIYAKNKVMVNGHNVNVTFVVNGSTNIVINTSNQRTFSQTTTNNYISVHFAVEYKNVKSY